MPYATLDWFDTEIRDVWDCHAARMVELYSGATLLEPMFLWGLMAGRSHGLWGTNLPDMLEEPELWLDDVLEDMARNANLARDRRTFRPFVVELDAYGTHYVDALFGCAVRYHEGQAWSTPLACRPRDLTRPDLASNRVFRRSLELARLARNRTGERVWISNPVLSCPLNIAMNLFGGRILEDLLTDPDGAGHALRIIADVIRECMLAFLEELPPHVRQNSVGATRWAPPGHGFLDGCATQLVSADTYARHIAPLDAQLVGVYPKPGMIHLCGAHAWHIRTWASMPEVGSVQLNDRAADDFELYWRGLRSDQLIYVAPTPTMTVERILARTGGRRVVLQAEHVPNYTIKGANA